MGRLASLLLLICLVLGLASPHARGDLPSLGRDASGGLSTADEAAMGAEIMAMIRKDPAWLDDPAWGRYLQRLGQRISPGGRIGLFLIRDDSVNAFALPGGHVGVHTGLVDLAQSESELAAVVAHEIAHVEQRHIARIIDQQRQMALPTLAALAVAVLAARSNAQMAEAALATAGALNVQKQLDFTRDHEHEADRVGMELLTRAGFDPWGMVRMFRRLLRDQRHMEGRAPVYLRTHPLTSHRIADMEARAAELPWRQRPPDPEYPLLRARLQASLASPRHAIARFSRQLDEGRHVSADAARYGLAWARLRDGDTEAAARTAETIADADHPLVVDLRARIARQAGRVDEAARLLRDGLERHPDDPLLVEALADVQAAGGQFRQARQLLADTRDRHGSDPWLARTEARLCAATGDLACSRLAEADALAARDAIEAAVALLEQARREGHGNFRQQSLIASRLAELRARLPDRR